ncbi:MAG: zinc ABC transporter substrate-binding protein [Clostridia bacterium]|nr:zinc ABC transporter substrate-binding protein [Clostridia bacterium]
MIETLSLVFSQQFLLRALVVGMLISACCALLGVSLVLKRFSMIGDGLSHVGFGAIAIACAANVAPLYFALPIVVVAAFLLLRMNEKGKIKGDSAIALISTGALAVGVLATSLGGGLNIDIYSYMFGSILTMTDSDVVISVILTAVIISFFIVFYEEIFAVTYDESFAKATGTKVGAYNTSIAVLTAVTIVIGMRMMGAMLISGLIIFPTVIAMRVCKSYKKVVVSSVFISVICFFLGLVFSVKYQAPTGAVIVCVNILALGIFSFIGKINSFQIKMMSEKVKKALSVFVLIACVLILVFISSFESLDFSRNSGLSVITTNFASYDFARQICGEKAQVTMLLSPGEESHTFEPTAQDIINISSCDVFVYGGGESDEWVREIISSVDATETTFISMMDVVDSGSEHSEESCDIEDHDHIHEYDEHVWTSPSNAVKIIEAITDAVSEKNRNNKLLFEKNSESYIEKINNLSSKFRQLSQKAKGKSIIVADRFPFKHFADEFSFNFYAAFPGCSAQSEADPVTLAFLIEKVKEEKIPVIFKVDLSSGNVARCIKDETGAEILTLYSCHNVSSDDLENGESYVSLMTKNYENLNMVLS